MRTSGGIFCDMTIHDFDMARFFVPQIAEVHAYGGNVFSDYTRDAGDFDSAVITMRGAGDELITIVNSRHCAYGYEQRLEAFGSEGMLTAEDVLPTTIRELRPRDRPARSGLDIVPGPFGAACAPSSTRSSPRSTLDRRSVPILRTA